MHDEPSNYDFDPDSINQMQRVMSIALRQILDEKPLNEFLDWARTSIPILAPLMFDNFTDEEQSRMAYWMGVNLWSSAPQPSNHFKPNPIPKPSRNSICPCGSGKKFKQCCAHLPELEQLHPDTFWMLLPEVMPKTQINRLIKNHQLPLNAIVAIASLFSNEGDDAQVIKMLDPLFEGQAKNINHKQSGLLDMLCDSYNAHYKTDKKKSDLLHRMCQHKDHSIRAEAWQRIASWQMDSGDFTGAMAALTKAMQAEPDNPSHSLLELTLLVSSKKIEQAKQRATFWRRKLKRYEFELPELLDTLERAETDPAGALQLTMSHLDDDPRLLQLLEWVEENKNLPIAEYTLEKVETAEDEEGEGEELPYPDPMQHAVTVEPSEQIFDLEIQWDAIKPSEKPFGTQLEPMGEANMGEINIWENIFDTEWLSFLQQNPQAINSLNILDDLVTLIYIHPNNDSVWGPLGKIQPLLDRCNHILRHLNIPGILTLPWVMPENRPALRLLTHDINLAINQNEHARSIEQIKLYLHLNPHDNHGYRSLLINHYLQHNENQKAIEFAANYSDDMLAETRYGCVLAHYRLGDFQAAEQTLQATLSELPLVAQYLVKARVAQPELSDYGISYGGKDQAWFYREEMRETWKQTEGCLAWLKKQLK